MFALDYGNIEDFVDQERCEIGTALPGDPRNERESSHKSNTE